MFPPQSNPGSFNSGSIVDGVKNWWNQVPFVNKSVIVLSTSIYLAGFIFEDVFNYLSNSANKTIYSYQLWRLLTSTFSHRNLFTLLICLYSLIPDTIKLEKMLGSVVFLFDMLVKSLQVQIVFVLLMTLLNLIVPQFRLMTAEGLWILVMVYLTIRCASNPEDPTYFLCLPVVIKQKYYPILIVLIFYFLGSGFSLFISMLVGYAEFYFFNSMMIRLSLNRAMKIESSCLFRKFFNRQDFVSSDAISSPYFRGSYGWNESERPNNPRSGENAGVSSGQAFQGSGVQIGSSLPRLPNVSPPYYGNSTATSEASGTNNQSRDRKQDQNPSTSAGAGVFAGKGVSIGSGPGPRQQEDDILKQSTETSQTNTGNMYVRLQNEEKEADVNKKPEDLI